MPGTSTATKHEKYFYAYKHVATKFIYLLIFLFAKKTQKIFCVLFKIILILNCLIENV